MKTITAACAVLWAVMTLSSLYHVVTFSLFNAPSIATFNSIVWLLTKGATATFFFVLWKKQE